MCTASSRTAAVEEVVAAEARRSTHGQRGLAGNPEALEAVVVSSGAVAAVAAPGLAAAPVPGLAAAPCGMASRMRNRYSKRKCMGSSYSSLWHTAAREPSWSLMVRTRSDCSLTLIAMEAAGIESSIALANQRYRRPRRRQTDWASWRPPREQQRGC